MATRMSITNSVWTAVKATERALEHVFNYTTDVVVTRADVHAFDPFAPSQRDCYITLHFRKGPGNLFGSIQTWVLLKGDGRGSIIGEQWEPERVRIISNDRTGPGGGRSFRFENWMMSEEAETEATAAWEQANKRRVQYPLEKTASV